MYNVLRVVFAPTVNIDFGFVDSH